MPVRNSCATSRVSRGFLMLFATALLFVSAVVLLSARKADAAMYAKENLIVLDKKELGGGKGVISGLYAFTRDKAAKEDAIKEITWLTIQPGDSVGFHQHTSNEDSYIIISGTGVFKDTDGKEYPVKMGDVTIARRGDSHALFNTGKDPLVFISVIAE